MSETPANLRFADSHEWAQLETDGTVRIGISDHAQDALGDLVYVELPEVGQTLDKGGEAGVVESVKAASDIYAPITGEVIEINAALVDEPELVNKSPYGDGWLYRVKPSDTAELDELLDAAAYEAQQDH